MLRVWPLDRVRHAVSQLAFRARITPTSKTWARTCSLNANNISWSVCAWNVIRSVLQDVFYLSFQKKIYHRVSPSLFWQMQKCFPGSAILYRDQFKKKKMIDLKLLQLCKKEDHAMICLVSIFKSSALIILKSSLPSRKLFLYHA